MFKNQAWTPTREVIQMNMVVDVQKEFQRPGQLIHPPRKQRNERKLQSTLGLRKQQKWLRSLKSQKVALSSQHLFSFIMIYVLEIMDSSASDSSPLPKRIAITARKSAPRLGSL